MKLLIITQKVDINDDILGFFHGWLERFAEKVEKIHIICLWRGNYNLPKNVKIFSLGKEKKKSRLRYIFNFYKYIWQERKNYDTVFVHMNPIYIILGGLLWRLWRKKIALWYTHKAVNLKLRIAEKLTNIIFTASKESFRLISKKVKVMGHGIDVSLFKPVLKKEISKNFRILSVGRISPIKDYETLIKAIDISVNQKNIKNLEVKIIGSPILKRDYSYSERLKDLIARKGLQDYIEFIGEVPYLETIKYYREADISVNLCSTGGADKVVFEAMACEIPTLVCNRTFREEIGAYMEILFFKERNAKDLAKKMLKLRNINQDKIGQFLRQQVVKHHSLDNLINKIISQLKN